MLRAGLEPATCRSGVDNGDVAGPQQCMDVAVVGCDRVRTRTAAWPMALPCQITEPLRPATVANPPGFEPGPARLELAMLAVTPRVCEADDPARTGLSGTATRCSAG